MKLLTMPPIAKPKPQLQLRTVLHIQYGNGLRSERVYLKGTERKAA